jgi:phage baseplate assembly protein W
MFNSSSTNLTKTSLQATTQNLLSLLGSERGEFVDDPDYGVAIKRYIFEQNNTILRDIIIDELYTQISVFIPQVIINRKDITIRQNGTGKRARLEATIKVTNRLDFTTNTFNLVLFNNEEQ